MQIASVFAVARRTREALDVAEAVATREEPEADAASSVVALAALHAAPHMTPDERNAYDAFHRQRIARAEGGQGSLGPAHYNFANHLRTSRRPRPAIGHYRRAAEFDPGYRDRPYFWRELGSSLFLEGRYSSAAAALEKAVALGDYPRTAALYADALMFAGKFKDAQEAFASYLESHPPGAAEWRLKRHALHTLRAEFGDTCKRDADRAAGLLENAVSSQTEEALRTAIVSDPLYGLAWFNLGVLLVAEERSDEAQYAFVLAALCATGDVEAWCNAIALAFGSDDVWLLATLIEAAYALNGDAVLVQFAELLRSQPDGPASPEILEAVTELVNDFRRDDDPFEIRLTEEGSAAFESAQLWRRPPPT
jgi:tetratricopeptide (TPR) repeat protein